VCTERNSYRHCKLNTARSKVKTPFESAATVTAASDITVLNFCTLPQIQAVE
jgi:hypothetical protein